MARVLLLGASGYTGRLVAAELTRRGHAVVASGRDEARVREAVGGLDGVVEVRRLDLDDTADLQRLVGDAEAVVTTVGPFVPHGRPVLSAALAAGGRYVDVTGEQPFLRWAYEQDATARTAGATAVPGAGFEFLPGDLLAHAAATALETVEAVHVTYVVRGRGMAPVVSAGTRRTLIDLLAKTGVALDHGRQVEERLAESRRLAWFPRPLGPRHAAGIAGMEPLTVPRHVPGVQTVRTYLALPGWQAELAQATANAVRWSPLRRLVTTVGGRGRAGPTQAQRSGTRWGCVAEATGGGERARAWASGTDIYGFAAAGAVAVAEQLVAGDPPRGVVAPAMLGPPGDLLDTLAARTDLLWSVSRPRPTPT